VQFSLLIATYKLDKTSYLKEALKSIDNQTVKPSEIVIVIDGLISSENFLIVKELKKIYSMRFIKLKKSVGLGAALKIGLSVCKYSLVARFDTDDICIPNRFEIQLEYMRLNPKVDVCGSYALIIDNSGVVTGRLKMPLEHKRICQIIWSNPIIHPSVMLRKDRILEIGGYSEDLYFNFHEDYELWIRSAHNGIIFNNIPNYLIKYRITNKTKIRRNTSANGIAKIYYGLYAWYLYDCSLLSLLALFYPLIRPFLPQNLNMILYKFDPRN